MLSSSLIRAEELGVVGADVLPTALLTTGGLFPHSQRSAWAVWPGHHSSTTRSKYSWSLFRIRVLKCSIVCASENHLKIT